MISKYIPQVASWLQAVFGGRLVGKKERVIRLTEEVMELAQAEGVSLHQIIGLAYQVYGKPVGEVDNEIGGTLLCLMSYFAVTGHDPDELLMREYHRVSQHDVMERIREKHDKKLVVSAE